MRFTYYRAPVTIALGAWLSLPRGELVIDLLWLTLRFQWTSGDWLRPTHDDIEWAIKVASELTDEDMEPVEWDE